jgi:hypothetical protein
MVAEPTTSEGAVVTYTVTAEDNVDGTATLDEENTLIQDDDVGGDITISCDPPLCVSLQYALLLPFGI